MREVLARLEANLLGQENATTPTSAEKGAASKPALKDEGKRRQALVKDQEEVEESLKKGPEDVKVGRPEEEADKILARAKKRYAELVSRGVPPERADRVVQAEITAARYRAESRIISNYAVKKHEAAEEYHKESEHKHHQADYFDWGELGVELALVLCSVAILTKRAGFWLAGIGVGLVGVIVVALGFFVH
jgi:hypothetical protein